MTPTQYAALALGGLLTFVLFLLRPTWFGYSPALARLSPQRARRSPLLALASTRSKRAPAELPTAMIMDILASALQAGLPLSQALALAGDVGHGPKSRSLQQLAHALTLGASWDRVWDTAPVSLQPLRKVLTLGQNSGAELSSLLTQASDDLRSSTKRDADIEAAKLAVHLMVPSGLLSLPAFVCLGIVPVIMSLFSKGWL